MADLDFPREDKLTARFFFLDELARPANRGLAGNIGFEDLARPTLALRAVGVANDFPELNLVNDLALRIDIDSRGFPQKSADVLEIDLGVGVYQCPANLAHVAKLRCQRVGITAHRGLEDAKAGGLPPLVVHPAHVERRTDTFGNDGRIAPGAIA